MKKVIILILVVAILAVVATTYFLINIKQKEKEIGTISISGETINPLEIENNKVGNSGEVDNKENIKLPYKLSDFDLSFLMLENKEANIIYSPLSIKYALKMLEEATDGEARNQISKVLGSYTPNKYASNANMSLANGMFIKDSFKDSVKQSYIDLLKEKFDAEIKFDSFKSAKNINDWISEKTLKIIPNILNDEDVKSLEFALINALAIDMEWEEKFLSMGEFGYYLHEDFNWEYPYVVSEGTFENVSDKISGMKLETVINNYDIVKELGEDNIRKTVGDEYRKFINDSLKNIDSASYLIDGLLNGDTSQESIEKEIQRFLDGYIKEIDGNYGSLNTYHHFAIADYENEKVFAKDLKEYDGTTLQYVAIMPKNVSLKEYLASTDANSIGALINTVKELKNENFKQGVITRIIGYIPKFKFEYDLNLLNDLVHQGVTDVFARGKANLTNLTNAEDAFISDAKHKANIEFTQDGIKAAAATMLGGAGAGDWFDYLYEVPVEIIDMTFDKPYLFLIRDKDNGEIWFVGTVYEPLKWEEDTTKEYNDAW